MSLKAADTKSGNPGQQKHWLALWGFLFPSGSGPAKSGRLLCALRECIKAETFALRLEPFQNVNPRNYRFCLLWILARQVLEQLKGKWTWEELLTLVKLNSYFPVTGRHWKPMPNVVTPAIQTASNPCFFSPTTATRQDPGWDVHTLCISLHAGYMKGFGEMIV